MEDLIKMPSKPHLTDGARTFCGRVFQVASKNLQATTDFVHSAKVANVRRNLSVDSDKDCPECVDSTLAIKIERVRLLQPFGTLPGGQTAITGSLFITPTHVMFYADRTQGEIWIATQLIESAERGSLTAAGCTLTIRCKHFVCLQLVIAKDTHCTEAVDTLKLITAPVNLQDVYAFKYESAELTKIGLPKSFGWDKFDLRDEYAAMGLDGDKWTVTDFNSNYERCETYPEWLVVPTAAHKSTLLGSCKFRSKGRLPVLTYYYKENHAAICRCSQPLAGFSARCVEDEKMMLHILQANPMCNVLYMVDTRPKLNALSNKAMGKGFEDERNYTNMRLRQFDIENIHVMRASLRKLVDALHRPQATVNAIYSGVEHSGWLRHLRVILACARYVADSVRSGVSTVVHCSDGWDRTAQTVALAQLLLEPRYRTLAGFRALIEKDWLAFGHKFTDRCAHIRPGRANVPSDSSNTSNGNDNGGESRGDVRETSPIFSQFIDAVWQLTMQFPRSFEFNERFLIDLNDQAHACQFGTFLGNCEKDRKDLRLSQRTYSYWASVHCRQSEFTNHLYVAPGTSGDAGASGSQRQAPGFLTPDVRIQAVRLWRAMYCRMMPVADAEPLRAAAEKACGFLQTAASNTANDVEQLSRLNLGQKEVADSEATVLDSAAGPKCIQWQSLRCRACAICLSVFPTGTDGKTHCIRCGLLVCRRCMVTALQVCGEEEIAAPGCIRVCVKCGGGK